MSQNPCHAARLIESKLRDSHFQLVQGHYDQETCFYTAPSGCVDYQVTCPDFPVIISGEQVTDTLRIFVDASHILGRSVRYHTLPCGTTSHGNTGRLYANRFW